MKLKPGTQDDFEASMAASMEQAFERVWQERMKRTLPEDSRDDRRMLFIAIAQGVIRHLQENAADAFDVNVNVEQTVNGQDGGSWITCSGTAKGEQTYSVTVTQTASAQNKVKSQGSGVVTIQTIGELYP